MMPTGKRCCCVLLKLACAPDYVGHKSTLKPMHAHLTGASASAASAAAPPAMSKATPASHTRDLTYNAST